MLKSETSDILLSDCKRVCRAWGLHSSCFWILGVVKHSMTTEVFLMCFSPTHSFTSFTSFTSTHHWFVAFTSTHHWFGAYSLVHRPCSVCSVQRGDGQTGSSSSWSVAQKTPGVVGLVVIWSVVCVWAWCVCVCVKLFLVVFFIGNQHHDSAWVEQPNCDCEAVIRFKLMSWVMTLVHRRKQAAAPTFRGIWCLCRCSVPVNI